MGPDILIISLLHTNMQEACDPKIRRLIGCNIGKLLRRLAPNFMKLLIRGSYHNVIVLYFRI